MAERERDRVDIERLKPGTMTATEIGGAGPEQRIALWGAAAPYCAQRDAAAAAPIRDVRDTSTCNCH